MKDMTYTNLKDVEFLNECIKNNLQAKLIDVCEDHQIRKINEIYNHIISENDKIVLITGPSSSGKTTFAQRLSEKFDVTPQILSMDDFFFDRAEIIKNKSKDHYESITAVNIDLFTKTVDGLLKGEEVWLPRFDFVKGESIKNHKHAKLEEGQVIFVEGIHALNSALLSDVSDDLKLRIYIHLGSDIKLSDGAIIKKENLRLIRRMVRDYQYRGCSPQRTMDFWEGVREFEISNILPFEQEADFVFNSFLPYEPCVLKLFAIKLVKELGVRDNENIAKDVTKKLENFLTIGSGLVPDYSILKEFI